MKAISQPSRRYDGFSVIESLTESASTLLELTKPRVTAMVVLTTAAGYYLGSRAGLDFFLFLNTLLGTGLLAGGTAVLNQWMEKEADSRMRRTRNRPVPEGRVSARTALVFGMTLVSIGSVELLVAVNFLTALLGWLTSVIYLLVYTPAKQRTPLCTLIGAVPGAVPPAMGWTAVRGELSTEGLLLFAILFAWQFPHFLAIAWIYKEDYERGGFKMLPLYDPGGKRTSVRIISFSILLLGLSILPALAGMAGTFYLVGAFCLGLYFLRAGLHMSRDMSKASARALLKSSVVYLPLLLLLMTVDKL